MHPQCWLWFQNNTIPMWSIVLCGYYLFTCSSRLIYSPQAWSYDFRVNKWIFSRWPYMRYDYIYNLYQATFQNYTILNFVPKLAHTSPTFSSFIPIRVPLHQRWPLMLLPSHLNLGKEQIQLTKCPISTPSFAWCKTGAGCVMEYPIEHVEMHER